MSDDHDKAKPPAAGAPAEGEAGERRGVEALLKALFPDGPPAPKGDAGKGKSLLDDVDGPSDESLAAESLADFLDDDDLLDDLDDDDLADLMPPPGEAPSSPAAGLLGPVGDAEDGAPPPSGHPPSPKAAENLLKAIFGGGDLGDDPLGEEEAPEDASEDADPAGALSMLQWMLDHQQLELEPGADLKALADAFTPILAPLLDTPDGATEAADWLADRPEVAELFISDEHLQALMDQW
ncbi:MAG: hypothetical protein ACE366_20810 [Bradymonadia bacterium]